MKKNMTLPGPIKKLLFLFGFMAVVYIVLKIGIPIIQDIRAGNSPIVRIEAQNHKEYRAKDSFKKSDFVVKAIHKNGQKTILNTDEFELSRTNPQPYGAYTKVTVSLKADKDISYTVKTENIRNKKESFPCGSPNQNQVKAVLYSNGELCFEGKGDVAQYQSGTFPWQNSDYIEEIKYITFQKDIKITSLDYFFSDMTNLEYVGDLPDSVASMSSTFFGCASLKNAPDWSSCHSLLDISNCYENCTALVNAFFVFVL